MEAKTQTPTLKESTIVERVARIVSSVRGTKTDYTRLAAELEPAIPFDVFGVVLLRHDREAVRVIVCQREAGNWVARYHQHPLGDSKLEQLLRDPVTLIANYQQGLDGPPARCGDALSGCHHLRSSLIAPLVVGERVLGALELGSKRLYTYDDQTLQRLIEAVVRVLATAIEGAQVGGSAEIQDRQRQALKDVSSALTSKVDLSSILTQIVEGIARSLNVSSAIVTYDQRKGKMRLAAQSGLDTEKLRGIVEGKEALSDRAIISHTLRYHQPCVSNDISADERFPVSSIFASELGIRSIFSYPLMAGATVYGALILCSPEPGGFTPLKADILSLFASQATIAIHNGMLIESAHQRSRFQKAIEQLEQAYEQNLDERDERELLARVRREAERTFGVSFRSLLYFISEHLLTRSERDLHDVLYADQDFSGGEHLDGHTSPLQDEQVEFLTQTAEAALARAEVLSELSRLLTQVRQSPEHTKDGLFVVDLQGLCLYMNHAAEAFCGMSLSAAAGNRLDEVFSEVLPRVRNAHEVRAYLQDFKYGTVYHRELRCVLAMEPVGKQEDRAIASSSPLLSQDAPSDRHYLFSRYPLFNQQGMLMANVLQIYDVTEQVRDEKNKARLLSSVSHDLRTPLTTIKAAVTGLLQPGIDWDEEVRRELLEEINAETDHLTTLINALVEMSRIQLGALELDKAWCDILEILDGALTRLEQVLAGRHVRTSIQPDLPLIYVDHVQIERVFYILLENAVHHSSAGATIEIAVEAFPEKDAEASPGYLRIKVSWGGNGEPAGGQEQGRIFKTFYGTNVYGLGLGLAICRGIIEAHQGSFEEGLDGSGNCFTLMLPVHASASSGQSSLPGMDSATSYPSPVETPFPGQTTEESS